MRMDLILINVDSYSGYFIFEIFPAPFCHRYVLNRPKLSMDVYPKPFETVDERQNGFGRFGMD